MTCRTSPNLVYWTVAQTGTVCPLTAGPPGCGKTKSVEAFAKRLGRQCYPLIGSILEPTDFAIPHIVDRDGKLYTSMASPEWVYDFDRGNWVLFLDEITTLSPAQQTPIMRIVCERKVGSAEIPGNVLVLAACNPPDCAANGTEIEPPLANRFCHLPWETPTGVWEAGMMNGGIFPEPDFPLLPADWRKSLGKWTSLVASFHKHTPGLLQVYPKDRAAASGPWPSMRSWTNAATCAASLDAIDAPVDLIYRAVAGCVGDGTALSFQTWHSQLDLPDPEAWLAQAINTRTGGLSSLPLDIPPRCDQVMAVLGALVDRVKNHRLGDDGKPTSERWLAAVDCFAAVSEDRLEPAIAAVGPLFFAIPEPGLLMKVPESFRNVVISTYQHVKTAE